jgi:tetratricopeptide (TPR) repeat protein
LEAPLEDRLNRLLGYAEADPNNYLLLCEAGDLCLELGDTVRAWPLLEQALVLRPDDPAAQYRMAVLLYQEKAYEGSLSLTARLLEQGHVNAVIRHQHVLCLVAVARLAEAGPLLQSLVDEGAAFAGLPHLYIRTQHYLGKVDEAAAYAVAHLRRHPHDTTGRAMLSLLLLDQEKYIESDRTASEVLMLQPDNLDALLAAGSTAIALEREEQAKGLFSRAIAVSPQNGRAWLGIGLNSMLEGRLEQAAIELERAVRYMPSHLGSWNALAWLHILQHDLDAAWSTFQHSLSVDRNFGEAHGGLAVVAAVRGDWEQVSILADTALRLQPDSFAGRFAHSLLLANRGRPHRASAMIDAMLDASASPAGGSLSGLIRRFAARHQAGSSAGPVVAGPITLH